MAIAGKVAITLSTENGGAWSADVTYDRLVAVKHNNNLYISRKTVANVEPPNNEFWFLALEGFSGDDIEDIINGTTQVGNAKTLDGHGASYFFPNTGGTVDGNIEVKSTNLVERKLAIENSVRRMTLELGTDGSAYLWDGTNKKAVITSSKDGTNTFNGTASGNLPLSGGGEVSSTAVSPIRVNNIGGNAKTLFGFLNNGELQGYLGFKEKEKPFYQNTTGGEFDLLHTGNMASHVLPLSGGTVGDGTKAASLSVRGSSSYSLIDYMNDANNTRWGCLGFAGANNPYFLTGDRLNGYALLHTGNKPTGTYTGNGDPNWRAIDVGSAIGEAVVIVSEKGAGIVTAKGVIGKDSNTNLIGIGSADCFFDFTNHRIAIMSASDILNASGVTYRWSLL